MRQPYQIREVIPKSNGGFPSCEHCGHKAEREALFKEDGIIVIEKYCEDCIKTENFTALMTFYGRNG